LNIENKILKDLLQRMLDKNSKTRITMDELKVCFSTILLTLLQMHEWIREDISKIETKNVLKRLQEEKLQKRTSFTERFALFQSVNSEIEQDLRPPHMIRKRLSTPTSPQQQHRLKAATLPPQQTQTGSPQKRGSFLSSSVDTHHDSLLR
jgi:serine/threonine protein kinase